MKLRSLKERVCKDDLGVEKDWVKRERDLRKAVLVGRVTGFTRLHTPSQLPDVTTGLGNLHTSLKFINWDVTHTDQQ